YLSVLDHPELGRKHLSSLRVAVTGASPIPPVPIQRIRQELGCASVTTACRLTECSWQATVFDRTDSGEVGAGTRGKPIHGTELAILDSGGKPVPVGHNGEICLRGFHLMQGYFDDPRATQDTFDAQGWLHTGDIGSLDGQGNLRITGRLKDMFI